MASPFSQAWAILKYFKNPHDEEEATYGGVSYREHPLFGQENYQGTRRDQPTEREMAEMDDPREIADDILMETPPKRRDPINIFDPKVRAGMIADRMGETIDEDEKTDAAMESPNRSPVRTIPMSPRGSVRGKGVRQAFDKPKKPEWWRTLTGEE